MSVHQEKSIFWTGVGRPCAEPALAAGRISRRAVEEVCRRLDTSAMALIIKSDEADRLARELASETGERLTEAVETALRERLDREHAKRVTRMRVRLARLAADVAALSQ